MILSEAEINEAENKINELRSFVKSNEVLFPLIKFLLVNGSEISFNQLNQELDKQIEKFQLNENFAIELQTWYSLLSTEQKATILFVLNLPHHSH